uniref:Uncharacterized protein n=1 Tax=Tanacetum cinerariifolium TaxID=118510 RepID=A0A699HD64_TANCI|nr:hypothetical protein [Tanacetum cinerariifolium]
MSTQQDIYVSGSENRPPMLNKDNYVPWSSRIIRYARSRPNDKMIVDFIENVPYVRRMIATPGEPDLPVVLPSVIDDTVVKEKQSPLVNTTSLGSYPPLPTQEATSASNALGKSLYANVTGKPSGTKVNFRTLFTPEGNEIDVVIPVESIRAIRERFVNTAYGFFLGKRVAYLVVANYGFNAMLENGLWFIRNNPLILKKWHLNMNLLKEDVGTVPVWVKLHGVPVTAFSEDGLSIITTKLGTPLMLDSYTSDMCMQSWGWSSYARAMIELRADVELKENIALSKSLKKTSQTPKGILVGQKMGFKPTKQVFPVSKKPSANTIINKKKNVEPTKEIKKLIIDGKVTLVDEEGKPLEKVASSCDYDSEDEVASVDNEMANILAKKDGYGTQSLLEQWTKSYENDDYGYDPYDDDMYEGQDVPDNLQAICNKLDITVRGQRERENSSIMVDEGREWRRDTYGNATTVVMPRWQWRYHTPRLRWPTALGTASSHQRALVMRRKKKQNRVFTTISLYLEYRPPMLNKDNYVLWSSRIIRYARSRPNDKMIVDSIENGPYVRRMIATPGEPDLPVPVPESFHEQIDEELTENDIKRMDADDQAIQTILLGLPEDVMTLGNRRRRQSSSMNEKSLQNIAANLKFLNNLQPEWKRHVTIVRQTKNLYEADFTQIYDFLKMNQDEDRQIQNVGGKGGNQFGQYAGQVAHNQQWYNAWQNGRIQVAENAVQNAGVQSGSNQNGLVVVPGIANQNETGNVVAARAEGIQLQAEEFDFMAAAGDLDEIKKVNANCILMANLQHASTSGTQLDKAPVYDTDGSAEYMDLLEPIPEPQLVPQNDNHVTSVASSMVQSGGTLETSSAPNEETRAHQETVDRNLVDQVAQVNMVNCNMRATNAELKSELARYKFKNNVLKSVMRNMTNLKSVIKSPFIKNSILPEK